MGNLVKNENGTYTMKGFNSADKGDMQTLFDEHQ